jgi:hypothetical protein
MLNHEITSEFPIIAVCDPRYKVADGKIRCTTGTKNGNAMFSSAFGGIDGHLACPAAHVMKKNFLAGLFSDP